MKPTTTPNFSRVGTNDSPRLVINGRFLTQTQTGVQRYARETLKAFDRLLHENEFAWAAGMRIQLAVPRNAEPIKLRAIDVVLLPRLSGHLWEQLTLATFAREALLVSLSYSGPVLKRRQLITVHDATVAAMPECFSMRYRWTQNLLLALLSRRVQTVMTVSEFSRAEIAFHYGIARNVVIGREGWEHSIAHGDSSEVMRKHGLEPGCYVLCVGSLKPNKNISLIPAALALMPEFPWTIALAGAADPRIFAGAPCGAGSNRLRHLGYVDDQELGMLYRNAAWFLFPSLYEGFGLPAIESMANGCPVIAAQAGSLPEICGDAALYFDPQCPESLAAVLGQVIKDPTWRETIVSRHPPRLAKYTWAANAHILAREIGRQIRPISDSHSGLAATSAAL